MTCTGVFNKRGVHGDKFGMSKISASSGKSFFSISHVWFFDLILTLCYTIRICSEMRILDIPSWMVSRGK